MKRCRICLIPHDRRQNCDEVLKRRAAKVRAEWDAETECDRRAVKNHSVDYGRRINVETE